MKKRQWVVTCLLVLLCWPWQPAQAKDDKSAFIMLSHISNVGAPDFTRYGFQRSYIAYEQYFYDAVDSRRQKIRLNRLERQAKRVRRSLPPGSFVQLDIEGWHSTNPSDQGWIREQYRWTLQQMSALLPDYQLGYYRIVPAWAHWEMHRRTDLHTQWEAENRQRQPIAELADVLYPALYTYHRDAEHWLKTARLVLQEARRMARGKPVIPFLWPHFHPSSDVGGKGKVQIPEAYWRRQLELVLELADGVIIWNDGKTRLWSDQFPWWRATVSFLQTHFPERLPVSAPQPDRAELMP